MIDKLLIAGLMCMVLAPAQLARAEENERAPMAPAKAEHAENAELYAQWGLDPAHLPYPKNVDARAEFQNARAKARAAGKNLMVAFGANWCPDCRALHRQLETPSVRKFAEKNFEIVNVDVGDFDRNLDLARELGIDLQMGIPVAIFYAPDGTSIGTTNRGELEPARTYTSRQILKFLTDVATNRKIAAPR